MDAAQKPEKTEDVNDGYDWVQIKAKLEESQVAPVGTQRLNRMITSNPFVPVGCLATVLALGFGLREFLHNRRRNQQLLMRARVGAQGFTVFALIGGIFYEAYKNE